MLDSFDCQKNVFAALTILAVTFSITQQYNVHIKIASVVCSKKLWSGVPRLFCIFITTLLTMVILESFQMCNDI